MEFVDRQSRRQIGRGQGHNSEIVDDGSWDPLPLLPGESAQSSVVQKNLFPGFDLSDRSDIPVFGYLSLVILPQNMF